MIYYGYTSTIEGMTVLSKSGWLTLETLASIIIISIGFVLLLIAGFLIWESKERLWDKSLIFGAIAVFCISCLCYLCGFGTLSLEMPNRYKVVISEAADMEYIKQHYEIIKFENDVYTIQEK